MAQTRAQITELIRRYVMMLETRGVPVERAIVFGSHASGAPRPDSDIDVAVISPRFETMSLVERYEALGLANRNLQAPLDVVGFSPTQITQCEPESFLTEILKIGLDVLVHASKQDHLPTHSTL
jgi:predicted nucleotidyltransferase